MILMSVALFLLNQIQIICIYEFDRLHLQSLCLVQFDIFWKLCDIDLINLIEKLVSFEPKAEL